MDAEKYNRTVSLQCPTCGCNRLLHDEEDGDEALVTCCQCGRTMTKASLLQDNSELIAVHAQEIGKAVVKDLTDEFRKSLQKAFGGSKHFTIK